MKLLLTALNAKYIHSALALHCLKAYAKELQEHIFIEEYTINHQQDFILQQIYEKAPDVVCFSCYIWNIRQITDIVENLKKILPNVLVILGGPEVSYDAVDTLENISADIVIRGEGEATFYELAKAMVCKNLVLENIAGITYRKYGKIYENPDRGPICLDDLPFVYDSMEGFEHRIVYYETQRGCPYSCQYCLSSIEKGVRFLSAKRVERDLQFFLDNNVPQVKFVDRTFNANPSHARHIWRYLIEHDNGVTNFHMEITADILDEASLDLLKKARKGLFQFEIGVQSTNVSTIKAIQRNISFEKLQSVVKKIKQYGNIHQHLDLIAGLPHEDYTSFANSFNDVYALEPEQLQLGFLKLLKGSGLRRDAKKYGIVYREQAAYEVLYTNVLSYDEICRLKQIEHMVEIYYNSQKALHSIAYAIKCFQTPFAFYEALAENWVLKNHHMLQHNKMELYTIFYDFVSQTSCTTKHQQILKDILKFDIFLNDNVKTLPQWLFETKEQKQKKWEYFHNRPLLAQKAPPLAEVSAKQLSKSCYIGFFDYDVYGWAKERKMTKKKTVILFDYEKKDSVTGNYSYYLLS